MSPPPDAAAGTPPPSPPHPPVSLRPATVADVPAIFALIRELAAFEKEPDAAAITAQDLVRDGFTPGVPPAFHVILAEAAADGDAAAAAAPADGGDGGGSDGGRGGGGGGGSGGCVVGMALWHHTYSTWTGRAAYVEDLIVTASWRGRGVGGGRSAPTSPLPTEHSCSSRVSFGGTRRRGQRGCVNGRAVVGNAHAVEGRIGIRRRRR